MLFGNTLRWDVDYLARQLPVLPARRRLPEEGQAARAPDRARDGGVVHRARHRLPGRGVPDGGRQQAPRLQGGAQRASRRDSPGTKAAFYLNFVERMAPLLAGLELPARRRSAAVLGAAARRRPARCARSAGSSSGSAAHEPVPVELLLRQAAPAAESSVNATRRRRAGAAARRQAAPLPRSRSPTAASSTATPGSSPTPTIVGAAEGVGRAIDQGRRVHGAAADARGLRDRDAARRAGDLPEGPGADLHARRHRPRGAGVRDRRRLRGAVDDDAALGRRDRRLRDARGLRQPGAGQRARASSARRRSTRYDVELRDSYAGIDPRTARSTGSCSTCPSRGRWSRTPRRCCGRAAILVAYTPVDHAGRPGPRGS